MAKNAHTHQVVRNGTSQIDRAIPALKTDQALIDGRSAKDFLQFAYNYAAELAYFNLNNEVDGNWQAFWETYQDKSLDELNTLAASQPHLALFLCFLHIRYKVFRCNSTVFGYKKNTILRTRK